jgi:hypothetical protein
MEVKLHVFQTSEVSGQFYASPSLPQAKIHTHWTGANVVPRDVLTWHPPFQEEEDFSIEI